ncbi:hypothetical protein Bca52824_093346 [Brassica carinata]|uniref:Uncharacterized protein n=1 Tax=Brassica carinata TaxID=52824 RepID=A0A8X7P640_BRACI|nr:hypothetical protein Bca52824_093346 [Brassica carinata]
MELFRPLISSLTFLRRRYRPHLFVAYLDTSTYLIVDDHKLIARRYLKSVAFVMDVLSTLPIQFIYKAITGNIGRGQAFSFLNLSASGVSVA